jgi:hypothetical protein
MIAMLKKAHEIHIDHPGFEILEAGGGIKPHQGGIVANRLAREIQDRQDAGGEIIAAVEIGRASPLAPHLAPAEVFGRPPERGQAIAAIGALKEGLQGRLVIVGEVVAQERHEALLFGRNGFANNGFLEGGVGRQNNPLGGAVLEDDAHQILRFGTDPGGLERDLEEFRPFLVMGMAVALVGQDLVALQVDRARIGQAQLGGIDGSAKVLQNKQQIVLHGRQAQGEEPLFGFKIAELEDEEGVDEIVRRTGEQIGFNLGQREGDTPIGVRKLGQIVDISPLGCRQDLDTLSALAFCWFRTHEVARKNERIIAASTATGNTPFFCADSC